MIKTNQIFMIRGTEYREMTKTLLREADLAALIGSREKRIGIKPNLVTPSPAEFGATTHTEVVAGILEYLQGKGFENILIAEGSWVGDRTSDAYEYCGYRTLCETYGVPFIDTKKEGYYTADCGGMDLLLTDVTKRIDFLINVPVLKGHCQTKMTCALKNMKGLLPDKEKRHFHRMGLHKPIAHLQKGIRQDFIVVDHICGDPYFEEGGRPLVRNCVLAAADPVLADAYACRELGLTPDDVPYVRMAEKLGVGSADLDAAEIIELGEGGREKDLAAFEPILDVSYALEESDSCSACYANLTGALWRLEEEGLLEKLDTKIGIGQGMQGKRGVLGVGRCTGDFDVSIKGCPPSEEDIYQGIRRYIEGK